MAIKRSNPQPARTSPAPVTKATGKVVDNAPEEQEEPTGNGGVNLSKVFDDTPAASGSAGINVPPGKYECIIVHCKVLDAEASGKQAALFKVEVADEGEHQGSVISMYYNLIDKAGQPSAGIGFLKRDLAKLGYADIKWADIPEALQQLTEAQDGVVITVKANPPYVNAYLDSLLEGSEIVEEWKRVRPETPY